MSVQFARLARFSAERPRQMQWFVTALMMLSCIGYIPWQSASGAHYGFHFEARPEELWALEESALVAGLHWYREFVPQWSEEKTRTMVLTLESKSTNGDGNMLVSGRMDSASQLHRELLRVRTKSGVGYEDVCAQLPAAIGAAGGVMASSPCFVYSLLEFWPPNTELMAASARLPCADVPDTVIQQSMASMASTSSISYPLSVALGYFTGCPSLSNSWVMAAGVDCSSQIPLGALTGGAVTLAELTANLAGNGAGVPLWSLCPVTCQNCTTHGGTSGGDLNISDSVASDPSLTAINLQSNNLAADRRGLSILNAEETVLQELCSDMPPSLLQAGTKHLFTEWTSAAGVSVWGGVDNCTDALDQLDAIVGGAVPACQMHLSYENLTSPELGLGPTLTPPGIGDASCWETADLTYSRCCNEPAGKPECWLNGLSYTKCCNDGKFTEVELQRLVALTPASFCPATCSQRGFAAPNSVCTSHRADDAERVMPLVTLNTVVPTLGWDASGLLGQLTRSSEPGEAILSATAVRVIFTLDCNHRRVGGVQDDCIELEDAWMEFLGAGSFIPMGRPVDASKAERGDVRARFFTLKGQNEEMLRAIFGTLPLLGLSGLLMTIYISSALVKRGRYRKHSKIFVGAVGNMIVGIAAVMTFGICCGLGVDITPISQVVPFLLLGVGVDDMFVIVRTLERIDPKLPTADRIELAFRRCGGAIAVTSFTDGLAFLVGSTIKFPAMSAFCINAGVGVLLLFVLQLTFMAATLAMSDQAMKGNPSYEHRMLARLRDKIEGPMDEATAQATVDIDEMPSSFVRDCFANYLAPFVEHGSAKAHYTLLAFFGALGLCGLIGATHMQKGFPLTDVFCDDSYVSDFLRSASKHFSDQAYPFYLIFRDVDYTDPAARDDMVRVATELSDIRLDDGTQVVTHPMSNWLTAYTSSIYFHGAQPSTFYTGLAGFMSSPEGLPYSRDVAFTPDGQGIVGSRFVGFLPGDMLEDSPLHTAQAQEELVEKMSAVTHNAQSRSGIDCFTFTMVMLVWEVWTTLVVQMFINLGQSFFAIWLCTSIFLLHPATALIVTVTVGVVELELAACCAWMGIQLNTVTVVIFIMVRCIDNIICGTQCKFFHHLNVFDCVWQNFGLVVDYSAHIAHHFMTTGGTPRQRAAHAVVEMGSGVFNGACTTALGMLPLIWAPFETGRVRSILTYHFGPFNFTHHATKASAGEQ